MTGRRYVTRLRWFTAALLAGTMLVALGIATRVVEQAQRRELESRIRAEVSLWALQLGATMADTSAVARAALGARMSRFEVTEGVELSLFDRSGRPLAGRAVPKLGAEVTARVPIEEADLRAVLAGREVEPLVIHLGWGADRWDWVLPMRTVESDAVIGAIEVRNLKVDPSPFVTRLRLAFLALSALALASAFWFARRSGHDLAVATETLRAQIAALGSGATPEPIGHRGWEELAPFSEALHRVSLDLESRLRDMSRQLRQQDALLASMIESVVAVDREGMVLLLNPAAGRLFGVAPSEAAGRPLREIARQTALHQFVERAHESSAVIAEEIVLPEEAERCLLAHGTTLTNPDGQRIGALVVLNDITTLRRLENHRREFVANVSRELKTPITSIRGFVETLRDAPPEEPAERARFLEIILRQADRLHAIIEDLLSLSRLEQEAERERLVTEEVPAVDVLEAAALPLRARASEKEIALEISADPALILNANPRLLEQAIANLIDNAIKYSERGTTTRLRAWREGSEAWIEVEDQGPGIEAQHLPRLFERFYRVDKGRSRRLGGTGLGLAIVKHIVHAHGGTVSVESRLGIGSRFRLELPLGDSRSSDPVLTRS